MIQEAQVNLTGYVAADPRFKKVTGDISSTKLRVAYTARRRDRDTGEWSDGPTSFVNIQCWRTLAENVLMSVHKGEPVLVTGRLQIRRYQDSDGVPRTAAEIEAVSIGHDLTRGVAQFSRTRWPSAIAAAAAELQAAAAEPGDSTESGGCTEPGGGQEAGDRPGQGAGAPDGDGVIDESAVAEFARELSHSLGPDATVSAPAGATADAEAGLPA